MLRPHDREDAELDEVRFAAERGQDALIFLRRKPVFGDDLGGDGGGGLGHGSPCLRARALGQDPRILLWLGAPPDTFAPRTLTMRTDAPHTPDQRRRERKSG